MADSRRILNTSLQACHPSSTTVIYPYRRRGLHFQPPQPSYSLNVSKLNMFPSDFKGIPKR